MGATHPKVAASLSNLASLYAEQGAYTKAEPLFLRALDIDEASPRAPRSPAVIVASPDYGPLPDPATATPLAERGMVLKGGTALAPSPQPDDPLDGLDHAGLAMAGANQGAGGIVTAREIAGFDWWGTKLVVLSACETGVGPVPSGDGVYGLRRAVVLAGAEAQVVSLWDVNDLRRTS